MSDSRSDSTSDQQTRSEISLSDVTVIIGLEIHVQLDTRSKLFCGCSTEFGAPPNTQTCPVCTGQPGSLPVLNRRAIELAIQTGLALNCDIATWTKWDRKNYFYPDLPKGYQISQFDFPVCGPGELSITCDSGPRTIGIERAHLEEDAGKSIHGEGADATSKIDLNRTGTPLLEIVTRPDLRSPAEAKAFLTELKLILNYLGVSDCNMQEGSLRCDGNINLHIPVAGQTVATPIVEIKNLNSFRAAERSLTYEAERQLLAWQQTGQTIADAPKQTRGWDDAKQVTLLQREKELSADYRYFPDPDLVPVTIAAEQIETARQSLKMLPAAYRAVLITEHKLKPDDAEVIVAQGRGVVEYFLRVAAGCGDSRVANNWISQEVLRHLNESAISIEDYSVDSDRLVDLLQRLKKQELDQTRAKDVLNKMVASNLDAATAIESLGIVQVDDAEIKSLCERLIAENANVVQQIRDGNAKAIGALIGKARKENPNANPGLVKSLLLAAIAAGE